VKLCFILRLLLGRWRSRLGGLGHLPGSRLGCRGLGRWRWMMTAGNIRQMRIAANIGRVQAILIDIWGLALGHPVLIRKRIGWWRLFESALEVWRKIEHRLLLAPFFFRLDRDNGHPDQPGEKPRTEHQNQAQRNLQKDSQQEICPAAPACDFRLKVDQEPKLGLNAHILLIFP
jgi:hypothetical protein